MSRKKGNMYAQGSTPMYTTGAHTSSCIETGVIKEETQKQHYRLKSTAINHGPLVSKMAVIMGTFTEVEKLYFSD